MAQKEGTSGWKKAYLVLRWPVVFGVFGLAAVFFLTGLETSLGYNGTSALRSVKANSKAWKDFNNDFSKTPARGTPFMWKDEKKTPAVNNSIVAFDSRLIDALEYLKKDNKAEKCGWNGSHELLTLDVNSPKGEESDLTNPPDKPVPLSTINRGVGVRINQADRIKCTEYPVSDTCADTKVPIKFPKDQPEGFPISLTTDSIDPNNKTYDKSGCKVICTVDYYPTSPVGPPEGASAQELVPPLYSSAVTKLANFNPQAELPTDYEQIGDLSRRASLLKNLLISYELMHIDDAGCQSKDGNTGYNSRIPNTLIMPMWVREKLGDNWQTMVDSATKLFPFNFQQSSLLAGLAADPVLNTLGLHFNY